MTAWAEPQRAPLTWEMFLGIDPETRRDLELVDGYLVPREQRSSEHQAVLRRLLSILEEAAGDAEHGLSPGTGFATDTEVDVLLWREPPTARKPDAVLYRALAEGEELTADHVVIVAEVLSTWSQRRDRVHKMADYADAAISNYWLVHYDRSGVVGIERYALLDPTKPYRHIGTTYRSMTSRRRP
ncbi:Uma2 family endonuclease [Spiractinospora alimapuensis]|uniref:Uma2 family endonuclease n=1 Tax=Spiractinospora alimapuensis TaxID=2820884 RepID=UPI001F330DC2|nr:Uma2 family endonuclease [Spiractinospora alimapuensis]